MECPDCIALNQTSVGVYINPYLCDACRFTEPDDPSALDSDEAIRLFAEVENDMLISQGSKDYISLLRDIIKKLEAEN